MKTIEKRSVWSVLKLAFLAVLLVTASCSQEMAELEANQEGVQAKNSKAVLKTLAKGAKIHGTNGIYFGPDDNLYIASFYGQEIVVMDKESGKIINRFGVGEGVLGPDDLVFHPDGKSFFFTDIVTGYVGEMNLKGEILQYAEFKAGNNPITFLEDENDPENPRLFVALDFQGEGLYELDPEDLSIYRAIIEPSGSNPFPLGFFNAFDFGPDGRLYGPSFLFGKIISVDVGEWGDPPADPSTLIEEVVGGFDFAVAAKFGPDGLLTVLDQNGKVYKVDIVNKTKTLFTTLQPGLDNLAFDKDGTLYVSNADFGWIVEILPSRQARTISTGGMIGPMGVAVLQGANNKDDVFVGDLFRMYNFNGHTGNEKEVYKGYLVPETDKLTMPFSVQADTDGENLIVTSWFSELVQVWNPESELVTEEYPMVYPIDAVRVNGEIAVSDLGLGGVVWASNQDPILPIDDATVFAPGGLATDGVTLWVADWGSGIVWEVNFNGSPPFPVANNLKSPEGLAFEKEGSLVVVETGESRLSRIDLNKDAGENVTIIAENLELSAPALPGGLPTWWFDGVAVGPSGDIYVTGGGANALYRVSPK
ncbi:hypothetical protein [Lutimonas vermicola]|uniref:SMP-30/Gluconolactonase/LRE-like region domain-containing protein n=1 Tax=Lutimonas vermicola TaxID=414288 RepID=A0ABU9L2U7_9FLAO